jgi:hypothetical protein
VPFLTESVHNGAWHVTLHTLLWQSVVSVHVLPVAHREQAVAPPQSVSLSPPFLTVSLHAAAWQMLPVQTPL